MKNRMIKTRLLFFIIIIAILVPYPSKVFNNLIFSIVNEKGLPINVGDCEYDFSLYPSIKTKTIKFKLDENGEARLGKYYVWMNWLLRRGYNILNIISRSGWSDRSSTLTIKIPHKVLPHDKQMVAYLNIPDTILEQKSVNQERTIAGLDYKGNKGQYWSVETRSMIENDIIALYISKSILPTASIIKLILVEENCLNP